MRSGAKGGPARATRLVRFQRFVLAVIVLGASLLLFPGREQTSEYGEFKAGQVAPRQVVAPFDFEVMKDEAIYDAEVRRARSQVAEYFRRDDSVMPRVLTRFEQFRSQLGEITADPGSDTLQVLLSVGQLGIDLSDRAQRALLHLDTRERVVSAADDYLREVLSAGVADADASEHIVRTMEHMLLTGQSYSPVALRDMVYTQERANRYAQEMTQARFAEDPVGGEAFRAVIRAFLEPGILYDGSETERIREAQASLVTPVERRILKGEEIVDAHQIVTPEAMRALDALAQRQLGDEASLVGWKTLLAVVGRALITAAILMFVIIYLRLHRPRVYADTGKLVLLTITALVVFGSASIVLNVLHQPWLLIPVAAGSMIVSLLIDAQLGVFFTLVSVLIVALNASLGLDFVSGSLVGGFTAVYSVRTVRHRSEIFRALVLVSMAYIYAVCAQGMIRGDLGFTVLTYSAMGVGNALLCTAVAVFLIPILEMTCRVTTDLTLLELSDLNRPLLKRLMLEAPGTYHHSMVMGTLAEAACEAVDANSLRGRVQCYYHDIGKLNKPEYFIENIALNPKARNPHDRLTPSMSCLILESHVREGVTLARDHKLPEVLIDGIREHHGTSLMTFFYDKAQSLDPTVDEEDFHYPGPKPQSKETAVLMLADGVEAASRVLSDPRPSRIRQLVRRIIEDRVEAGELEACGLTLADLAKIREAFVLVLTGMFHGRIRYPADVDAAAEPPEVSPPVEESTPESIEPQEKASGGAAV